MHVSHCPSFGLNVIFTHTFISNNINLIYILCIVTYSTCNIYRLPLKFLTSRRGITVLAPSSDFWHAHKDLHAYTDEDKISTNTP